MRPHVLLTKRIPSTVLEELKVTCDVDLHAGDEKISVDDLRARVQGKQGLICLITERVDSALLDAGRDLQVVSNIAVGYDNIDVAAARARGIIVTNTPGVLTDAVAECTWALMLGVMRRVGEGERTVRGGRWKGWALDFQLGCQLTGKQLGIIGMGEIGQAVAAKAKAFGMQVAYWAREGRPKAVPVEYQAMPLDQVLTSSDVVSLHVPLRPDTRHLIDQKALMRMKRSAYLVNMARGPVVDEGALVWALDKGIIAGAALDVYEQEPVVHPGLFAFENVLLAPHIASGTVETRTAMAALAVRNAVAVLSGHPPLTPVP
jgi:glyoxylate reductase